MTSSTLCDAVDFNGARCGLQAGHNGQHAPAIATKAKTSFARILVTPLILIVAAILLGGVIGQTLPAIAVAAVVSIVYILWASRH